MRAPGPIYYHGTHPTSASSILRQGFKVGAKAQGRNLGDGLYLTPDVGFAASWGSIIFRCRLVRGTRILWHTPVDERTIKYLKKEFGANITSPAFAKHIPANKQLTKSEVAHLWNYLLERHYLARGTSRRRDLYATLIENYSTLYKQLKRHGYDGFGMTAHDWPEMFLFNPSRALAISAHTFTSSRPSDSWIVENVKLSAPLTLSQLDQLQNAN